ncbi:hypothetical protein RF11_03908 [Thelohanellus kitauei]|uniref:Uncharacterized protein n=1 Tax=Thelohanellus kitauei TaxID=669202 RepID=A0A0C2NAN7_THEKT|nr:hypothetical protein RF11_03908 [Thelohanellus kitauei]
MSILSDERFSILQMIQFIEDLLYKNMFEAKKYGIVINFFSGDRSYIGIKSKHLPCYDLYETIRLEVCEEFRYEFSLIILRTYFIQYLLFLYVIILSKNKKPASLV